MDPIKECRRYVRPAVTEHLRHWWGSDGLFHKRIRTPDGKINPLTVRQIFRAYGVGRGLLSGKEGEVAEVLDEELESWPETLLDRAEHVCRLAERLSNVPSPMITFPLGDLRSSWQDRS